MSKRDYLKITIVSPNNLFEQHKLEGLDVPRKGEKVFIQDEYGVKFSGEVEEVIWTFEDFALGNSVIVFLK